MFCVATHYYVGDGVKNRFRLAVSGKITSITYIQHIVGHPTVQLKFSTDEKMTRFIVIDVVKNKWITRSPVIL